MRSRRDNILILYSLFLQSGLLYNPEQYNALLFFFKAYHTLPWDSFTSATGFVTQQTEFNFAKILKLLHTHMVTVNLFLTFPALLYVSLTSLCGEADVRVNFW